MSFRTFILLAMATLTTLNLAGGIHWLIKEKPWR